MRRLFEHDLPGFKSLSTSCWQELASKRLKLAQRKIVWVSNVKDGAEELPQLK